MFCEKCGHEINPGQLVCGYCGHAVPMSELSEEKKEEIIRDQRKDDSLKTNHNANIRGFGIALMVIGGICDVIGIGVIAAGSVEALAVLEIVGTVSFGLGLFFTFAFR